MGIYGAMSTAVTGLSAQAAALENISGNIANVQTTGFKRVDTSFVDMVDAEISVKRQSSGSVVANSGATNSVQGNVTTSQVETHAAINGSGYFVVQEKTGISDGRAIFGGVDFYTRRGDFILDAEGYLTNGSGYYVKSIPIDPATGNEIASTPELQQFQSDFLPAEATTEVVYRAPAYDDAIARSHLLNTAAFLVDPTASGPNGPNAYVDAADEVSFLQSSIGGGAITAYDSNGSPLNVQLRWAKTLDAIDDAPAQDTWNLYFLENSSAVAGEAAWRNVGQDYAFNNSGQLDPAVPSITIPSLVVDGVDLGQVNLTHGVNGLTQFDDSNGNASVTTITQNGQPAGQLVDVQLTDGGFVTASYDNGQSRALARIPLATFTAENQLMRMDGGAFAESFSSGPPILADAGQILAQSLENSNTDISEEFTKLIVTQQAYSANSRIISTADEMLQDVLSILR